MGSIIREYIESAGGNFLTTKNCKIGTTVNITSIHLDDETFDKSYIVVDGVVDPSGEECSVRLGVQNLERITETIGDDENKWPGQKLECIGTQKYPGLGTTGLLWRGLNVLQARPPERAEKVRAIIDKILTARPQLTTEAVKKLLEDEKNKAAGLITEEAAAHIVAANLKIDL
jgi:hypothetical protein